MNTRTDNAVAKFLEGYNCAQAVFNSYCEELHIDRNMALKIACGFGAGMGRKEAVCGAVTGGILVIGAKYGRGEHDDRTAQEVTYQKTRELMDRFTKEHDTVICRHLLNGCELMTEEGQRLFKENGLLNKTCIPIVRTVVAILETIL